MMSEPVTGSGARRTAPPLRSSGAQRNFLGQASYRRTTTKNPAQVLVQNNLH